MTESGPRVRRRFTPYGDIDPDGKVVVGGLGLRRYDTGELLNYAQFTPFVSIKYPVTAAYSKGEITYDETHPGPPYVSGGNFTNIVAELPDHRVKGVGLYKGIQTRSQYGIYGLYEYSGGFVPSGSYFAQWDNIPGMLVGTSLMPDTSSWEQSAYIRTRPRLQKASVMVAGAEFRDFPRMLKSTSRLFSEAYGALKGSPGRLMAPKNVADDFLNYHFGWIPFVSDVRSAYKAFQDHAAIKSRLTSENGRFIRKKAVLSDTVVETIIDQGQGMQVFPAGDYIGTMFTEGASPSWTVSEKVHTYVSAVGSYKYYKPEFDDTLPDYNSAWNSLNRDLVIYGARISPSNVYRATPWTWLIDWYTDFGSIVDRVTDLGLDGVVAQYLYVMSHQKVERVLTQHLPFAQGEVTLQWSSFTEAKVRRQASTPYGFGLNWHLLSPTQLAILAALKITRMK